jgi:hypothetical protein
MKIIYTLTFILLLAGCKNDWTEAHIISDAFLRACKIGTISTNIAVEGITKTITITCTKKDGN